MVPPPPEAPADAALTERLRHDLETLVQERDAAFRALQERETELARIQRIGKVGGVEVDFRDGFNNRRSPEYLIIHGLPPEARNETHEDWVNRIHPDDREQTLKHFLDALAGTEKEYSAQYRIIRPNDGQTRWINVVAEIERDAGGRPLRLIGAHIDVTDRMLAQETLRESEERFRLIADSAPVPMWVTKLDRTRAFANQAYVDFLGLPFEQAIVFDWRKVLHPEDLPRILQEQIAGESSLKPFVLEARYKRADGEWRWLRSESQPRWDPTGQHIGFIGIAHDITAAKHAEIELRRMNETARAAHRASAPRSLNPAKRRCARSSRPATSIRACSTRPATCSTPTRTALAGIRAEAADVIGKPFWETPWFTATDGMSEVVRSAFRDGHERPGGEDRDAAASCRPASAISISPCGRCSTSTAPSSARCPRRSTSPSAARARRRCGNRRRWRRSAS